MIDRAKLTNFQSHINSELVFGPGITVITGPTDVGKSAVIRALQWVVENQPSGDRMRRHSTKKTEVELKGVVKGRTKSSHYYKIGDVTFKALRTDVPDEVRQATGMASPNFQGQHQTYFLIGDSPGHRARTLNEVADLKIIDDSLKVARQRVREDKTRRVVLKERLTQVMEKVDDLDWVPKAVVLDSRIQKKTAEAEFLGRAEEKVIKISAACSLESEHFHSIPCPDEDFERLFDATHLLHDDRHEILGNAIDKVKEFEISIPDCTEALTSLHATDLSDMEEAALNRSLNTISRLQEEVNNYPVEIAEVGSKGLTDVTQRSVTLQKAIEKATACKKSLVNFTDDLTSLNSKYETRLKEIGACPLCGGSL